MMGDEWMEDGQRDDEQIDAILIFTFFLLYSLCIFDTLFVAL